MSANPITVDDIALAIARIAGLTAKDPAVVMRAKKIADHIILAGRECRPRRECPPGELIAILLTQDELDAVGHMGDFHADDDMNATPFTEPVLQSLRDKIEPFRSNADELRAMREVDLPAAGDGDG